MQLDEIVQGLQNCEKEAARIDSERQKTFHFFECAVKCGDGVIAERARQMLHIHQDAHLDNYAAALTLNEMLQKHAGNSNKS